MRRLPIPDVGSGSASLTPVLVLGTGRTGSTLTMALLSGGKQVATDLHHPYENRYLTEFLRQSLTFEEPFGRSMKNRTRWSLGDIESPLFPRSETGDC